MEFLDSIDFVTEEFDTNRMRQCWRKHVDNAASHCEFTTIHHQVDSSIRILHQSMRRLIERQLLTLGEHQRLHIPQARNHRLNQGTHRHDENPDGAKQLASLLRVHQSTEHRHTARHGIGARRKTFVRQGFPRFKLCHIVWIAGIPRTNRLNHFLGLTPGSHHKHNRSCSRCPGSERRTQSFGNANGDAGVYVGFRHFDLVGNQRTKILIGFEYVENASQRT